VKEERDLNHKAHQEHQDAQSGIGSLVLRTRPLIHAKTPRGDVASGAAGAIDVFYWRFAPKDFSTWRLGVLA
jgi:hypothetical protein